MRLCNNKVEDKDDSRRVTYCPLPMGHKGICIPDPKLVQHKRCKVNGCGMPEHGRNVRHQNGLKTWDWEPEKSA